MPRRHDMFGDAQPMRIRECLWTKFRAELSRTLDLLRSSEAMPWPVRQEPQVRTIPDIAAKLPAAEFG